MFDIIRETCGSQLALIPSVVLGHHDECHPKIFKNSRRIDVGSPDVF